MAKVRRSILFSFGDRYAAIGLNLIATAVLARILTPDDFGMFAVVAGFTMMLEAMREFGIGAYVVQAETVSRNDLRTAFTLSMLLSVAMTAVVLVSAEPVAGWYGEPGLVIGLKLATLSFLFVPFSVPPIAVLRRDMRFDRVALTTLCAALAQLIIAVGLGLAGFGYLSLVIGVIAYNLALALAAALLGRGLPMYRPCLANARRLLTFGGWASATSAMNVLYARFPQLVVGRTLGFETAGLLDRAGLLCQMQDRLILSAVQPVVLSLFSLKVRDRVDLKQSYLHAAGLGLTVQWPCLICLIMLANPIVAIVLGQGWTEAADLLRILAIGYLPMFAAYLTYPTLVASGRVRDTCTSSLISLPPSFLLIGLGALWSIQATAVAMALGWVLQMAVALHFMRAAVGFTWFEFAGALRPGALAALGAGVAPAIAYVAAGFSFELPRTLGLAAGAGAVAGWLIALILIEHPIVQEARTWLRPTGHARLHARPAGEARSG